MRWAVVVDRTVDPFDPRTPLVIGPFRSEDAAAAKRAEILRGLRRAHLDREVYLVPIEAGSTAIKHIVEDAA